MANLVAHVLKILFVFVTVSCLTAVTQVGGIVFLISLTTHRMINTRIKSRAARVSVKVVSFLVLYLAFCLVIVPFTAKPFGRVRLPITETNHLQPLSVWTCLLNRNYVRPELQQAAFKVADRMNKKYPGTIVNYLDANFPFINKFPLPPHLSHNDGKKLDLAFQYIDMKTGEQTNECPSIIGYGICEEPKPNEVNRPEDCEKKGYWQYSILQQIVPQGNKKDFVFDHQRTKTFVNYFADESAIGKILIEPHLKERLGLNIDKIRLHGCQAVRHDDHIHVQMR